jgi:hypothetical protein
MSTYYPKEVHYIFYLPGTGGNFMLRLFTLSKEAQFIWRRGTCGCLPANSSLEEKLKWYSFKEADTHKWLTDGHLLPHGLDLHPNSLFPDPGTKAIASSHFFNIRPYENSLNLAKHYNNGNILEKYYYIDVDPELYTYMNRYLHADLHKGNEIGGVSWEIKDQLINCGLEINSICLKNIIGGDESFLTEYKRICGLMELTPIDDTIALEFVNNWKNLRVNNPNIKS